MNKRSKLIFSLLFLLQLNFLIILPISNNNALNSDTLSYFLNSSKQPADIFSAIGPVFEEGADGFSVYEGLNWSVFVKYNQISPMFNINDIYLYNITKTNNSQLFVSIPLWIADAVWCTLDYYNSTNDTWLKLGGGIEILVAGYNSTQYYNSSFPEGQYFSYGTTIIPHNFTAANHTIVNTTISLMQLTGSISHTTPTPPNINGTWSIWNGTATTPGSYKFDYLYNDDGLIIGGRQYINGSSDWILVYETELERFRPSSPQNLTYFYDEIPVVVKNFTDIDHVWYRYDTGGGWSSNNTLTYNGSHFVNSSVTWEDGNYHVQFFGNDSKNEVFMREEWFVVDAVLPYNISHNSEVDLSPKIALDSKGNVHLVWSSNETGNAYQIFYDTNKNGHFGNKQQLTNTPYQYSPDIAIDPFDIVHLVWMDFDNFVLRYTNNTGGSFNPPVAISGLGNIPNNPAIAVDTQGHVHIVWTEYDSSFPGDFDVFYSNNTSGTFGTPVNVSLDNGWDMYPDIAVDSNGIVHVVYGGNNTGNNQIYYKNNSLGDFSMDPVNISRNNYHNEYARLALDSNNKVHVVWDSNSTGDFEIYYLNNVLNNFVSNPTNISKDDLSDDIIPAISSGDSIFVTWTKNQSMSFEIYESDDDLGSFSVPHNISQSPAEFDVSSEIAIDSINNIAHFTWMELDQILNNDFEILYYNYLYNPINILTPGNLTYFYDDFPIVVQNFSYLDEAWYRYDVGGSWSANYSLVYNGSHFVNESVTWNDGIQHIQIFGNNSDNFVYNSEEWFVVDAIPPLNLSHSDNIFDEYSRIALDSFGNVHVVWMSNKSGFFDFQIMYDTNKGGHFGNKIQITDASMQGFPSIAIDSSNIVHLVWVDMNNSQIKYANNSGGQFNPPISVAGIRGLCIPEIAIDSMGFAHVVWVDSETTFGGETEVYYTNNTGGSFGTPVNVTSDTAMQGDVDYYSGSIFGYYVDLGIDTNGFVHVIYSGNDTGTYQIYYKNNSIGDFSMMPINISRNAEYNLNPKMTIDSSDKIHVSWSSNVTGDSEIYYLNNTFNDFTSIPLNISKDSNSDDLLGVISIDKLTNPDSIFIVWVKNASNDIDLYESNSYVGDFSLPNKITNTPTELESIPDIDIDPNNKFIHLTWSGAGNIGANPDIYYDNYWYNDLAILSPLNASYQDTSITIMNFSIHDKTWYRTNDGSGWTSNQTLTWNGTHYTNSSTINWPDGNYRIQVFANDSTTNVMMEEKFFTIDNVVPYGLEGGYLSLKPQNGSSVGPSLYIWLNGTAGDLSSGVYAVQIYPGEGNSSTTWSINQNTNENWAFYNTSSIQDNLYGEVYEVKLKITDGAGNYLNLTFTFEVDATPPAAPTNLVDLRIELSERNLTITWTASVDTSNVKYEIWRKFPSSGPWELIHTTNFNETQFNEMLSAEGVYVYRIRGIDEAGQYGAFSNPIYVELRPEQPILPIFPQEGGNIIIIIIIIGCIAGGVAAAVTVVTVKKRKGKGKVKKVEYPKTYLSMKEDMEKYGTITPPKEPKAPVVKTEIKEVVVKEEALNYICPNCKKVYKVSKEGKYTCPQCKVDLERLETVTLEGEKEEAEVQAPTVFYYFCPNCNEYFKLSKKGVYNCPKCMGILKEIGDSE